MNKIILVLCLLASNILIATTWKANSERGQINYSNESNYEQFENLDFSDLKFEGEKLTISLFREGSLANGYKLFFSTRKLLKNNSYSTIMAFDFISNKKTIKVTKISEINAGSKNKATLAANEIYTNALLAIKVLAVKSKFERIIISENKKFDKIVDQKAFLTKQGFTKSGKEYFWQNSQVSKFTRARTRTRTPSPKASSPRGGGRKSFNNDSSGGGGAAKAPVKKHTITLKHPGKPGKKGQGTIYYRNNVDEAESISYRYPVFVAVRPENVSINLMWVTPNKDSRLNYLGGRIKREKNKPFEEVILPQIVKWMILNPQSNVVLWFDSQMSTSKQVAATKKATSDLINQIKGAHPGLILDPNKFQMSDLRKLVIVQNFSKAFAEEIPIYTRVNALRLIAAVETSEEYLKRKISSAFVYADYTVNPHSFAKAYPSGMPKDGFLGIKSTYNTSSSFENTFMIIGSQNPYTLGTIKDLVTITSKRLVSEIKHKTEMYMLRENFSSFSYHKRLKQSVFSSVRGFNESYIYGMQANVPLYARIREARKESPVQVDLAMNVLEWDWFFKFKNIQTEGITFDPSNFSDARSYIAVIDDPENVTITRNSGHGYTGVHNKPAKTIEQVVQDVLRR